MKAFLRLGILIGLVFPSFFAYANNRPGVGAVVINEIAWMGTNTSYNDEWIELYNNSSKSISLSGWVLKTDRRLEINLSGKIGPHSFFLLERTNNETLPQIKADLIYKGGLSNEGERIKLFDDFHQLIDEVDCSSEWFTGSNLLKKTMERIHYHMNGSDPSNWQMSREIGGTPKSKNSQPRRYDKKMLSAKFIDTNISFWKTYRKSFVTLIQGMVIALSLTIIGLSLKLKRERDNY